MFTVKSFTTRNSTCPSVRHRLLRDGKRTGVEFGSYSDASRVALARNLEQQIAAAGFIFDGDLASKLIALNRS